MSHEGSVTKLIGRVQQGNDDEAFGELFRRYFPRLVGLARKRLAGIPDPEADEEDAALWAKQNMKKPVVGFIAGVTAPPGKRMGHAGAIISGGKGTAEEKLVIMEECGIKVTRNPAEMGKLLKSVLC